MRLFIPDALVSCALMSQIHVRAQPGDIAPVVLLPGDPDRATLIAEKLFDDPVLYNSNRHLLGYTGTHRGVPNAPLIRPTSPSTSARNS